MLCRYLNKTKNMNTLYHVQLFMKVRKYSSNALLLTKLAKGLIFLHLGLVQLSKVSD